MEPFYTPSPISVFSSLRSGSLSALALTSGFEWRPAWFSAGREGLYFSMAPLPLCFQAAVGQYVLCLRAAVPFATLIVLNPRFCRQGAGGGT